MFTPSPDYLQQLFAYLQAGQQLLQQWTALAGTPPPPANPFMPPAAPAAGQPMPATPFPALPAPTAPDYAQQLFSYLQAWRQYLEQAASPSPTSPTSPTAPALGGLLQTASSPHHGGGSDTPTPPPDNAGTKSNMIKDTSDGQTSKFPPEIVAVGPLFKSQTQAPDSDRERLQVLIPPFMKNGNMIDPLGQQIRGEDSVASSVQAAAAPPQLSDRATPQAATAFQSVIDRVDRDSVQPMNAKSLFSPGFETPSG